jgi:hypothetical protein
VGGSYLDIEDYGLAFPNTDATLRQGKAKRKKTAGTDT